MPFMRYNAVRLSEEVISGILNYMDEKIEAGHLVPQFA